MKVLRAIINKEFKGYFKNYTAYIVLSVYLLLSFAATFYSAYFFEYSNNNLVSFFMYQPIILNMLIPALTMKMWAEERKLGTLEFLLTQPVNYKTLVWGKFLASAIMSCLLLVMTLPFVIISSYLVQLDILNIISGYIGLFFTIIALCSLGCLVSAFNSNVIIAYLSSLFCGWIFIGTNFNFLLTPLKKVFTLLSSSLNGILNFSEHYNSFVDGQIALGNIAYFISFSLLMIFLNIIIIEWHKS